MVDARAMFGLIGKRKEEEPLTPEKSMVLTTTEKALHHEDMSKLEQAFRFVADQRRLEDESSARLLSDDSTSDEKAAAVKTINAIFDRMWGQIAGMPGMKELLLHLLALDQSGIYRKSYAAQLNQLFAELSAYDTTRPATTQERETKLNAIKGRLPLLLAPHRTIHRFAHDTFPFGLSSLVTYKNRYHRVRRIVPHDDDDYGSRLELEDVLSGRRRLVGHALHRSNVRYAREIVDPFDQSRVLCNANGSDGYTWKTGCAELGYRTQSRTKHIRNHELRECKDYIATEYPDYPDGHLKLALCKELLQRRLM